MNTYAAVAALGQPEIYLIDHICVHTLRQASKMKTPSVQYSDNAAESGRDDFHGREYLEPPAMNTHDVDDIPMSTNTASCVHRG